MIYKILIIIFIFFSFLIFSDINIVSAEDYDFQIDSGLLNTGFEAGYDTDDINQTGVENFFDSQISKIIRAVLSFLGVIFLILTIYGGFLWMTARGNEQQVEKAKTLLTAAVVGLIIVISAYAISYFVINALSDKALIS